MTLKELFGNDDKYSVGKMLKIKADRDPVHTAIEMLSEENDIIEFLNDYIDWVKNKYPNIDPIVYTVLKINYMLEKTDGVFKNYANWKKFVGNTLMGPIQADSSSPRLM